VHPYMLMSAYDPEVLDCWQILEVVLV